MWIVLFILLFFPSCPYEEPQFELVGEEKAVMQSIKENAFSAFTSFSKGTETKTFEAAFGYTGKATMTVSSEMDWILTIEAENLNDTIIFSISSFASEVLFKINVSGPYMAEKDVLMEHVDMPEYVGR